MILLIIRMYFIYFFFYNNRISLRTWLLTPGEMTRQIVVLRSETMKQRVSFPRPAGKPANPVTASGVYALASRAVSQRVRLPRGDVIIVRPSLPLKPEQVPQTKTVCAYITTWTV